MWTVSGTDPVLPANFLRAYRAAMADYGQFCPVAKPMEVLDERWTLLVVRELLM